MENSMHHTRRRETAIKRVLVMLPMIFMLAACVAPVGAPPSNVTPEYATQLPIVLPTALPTENSRPQSGGGSGNPDGLGAGLPDAGNGPFETLVTTIASIDTAGSTVTFANASTAGPTGLVDENTLLRLADITPNGAPIAFEQLSPGMSVQAEILVETGNPPRMQAIWIIPDTPAEPLTDKPIELRDAPIRSVDLANPSFVMEPEGETILFDENTTFILDDETVDGVLARPEDLVVGMWAHVTLLQGPDGPLQSFPPEEPLTAIQVIIHN
jgi:hypothetical protein